MVTLLMDLRSLRHVLDKFCAEQGLLIGSPAALDAARHSVSVGF